MRRLAIALVCLAAPALAGEIPTQFQGTWTLTDDCEPGARIVVKKNSMSRSVGVPGKMTVLRCKIQDVYTKPGVPNMILLSQTRCEEIDILKGMRKKNIVLANEVWTITDDNVLDITDPDTNQPMSRSAYRCVPR